jgi:SP family general alpha glucoside:H+ symporter-like MFS transporter
MFIIGGLGFLGNRQSDHAIGSLLIFLNVVYNATVDLLHDRRRGVEHAAKREEHRPRTDRVPSHERCLRIIVPRILLSTAWNWGPSTPVRPLLSLLHRAVRAHARAGLPWGASAGLSTVYCLLRLPSTGGRSYGALDLLFEHEVTARRLARTGADRACPFEVRGARAQLIDARRARRVSTRA